MMQKTMPVARRVFEDSHDLTLKIRWLYAVALRNADGATLDDIRESVATLEEIERIARRVLGGAHPTTKTFWQSLQYARAALRAHETPPPSA